MNAHKGSECGGEDREKTSCLPAYCNHVFQIEGLLHDQQAQTSGQFYDGRCMTNEFIFLLVRKSKTRICFRREMIMHEDTKCLFDLRTCCTWFVLRSKYLTGFNWNTWTSICFHCKKFISVFESAITTNPRILDRRTHTFCTLFDRAFPLLVLPVVCTVWPENNVRKL